jgi:hypothetical protein
MQAALEQVRQLALKAAKAQSKALEIASKSTSTGLAVSATSANQLKSDKRNWLTL